jgi:hypothetical protein
VLRLQSQHGPQNAVGGIWEIVGTPIEGVQGDKYNATVVYDENDRVVDLTTTKVASAM